jgi:poly-gamma-glutamate capsule biosynthesis protein CapA/YwtB (metallophosphatase superfamily)
MINKIIGNAKPTPRWQVVMTGDVILDEPDADHWLGGIAPALHRADLAIGHLEVPHTRRGVEMQGDIPAAGADPAALAALSRAGFSAMSLAGNHIADRGAEGIADTLQGLQDAGVAACGAGPNLRSARQPVMLGDPGARVALLSYNCVGPESAWAGRETAGCAYLRIDTADGSAINPRAPLSRVSDEALQMLARDITAAGAIADRVIVALHKGIVHTPVKLAEYERPLAQAAVDAGADVVIGHHAHIIKGIEIYRGKPIFHGLGNGCVVTRALSPHQSHPERAAWAVERKRLFGFEPDPAYELAPFHPEAVNAMIAVVGWGPAGEPHAGIIPVHVEAPGRPVLADPARAAEIARYVEHITRAAGLPEIRLHNAEDWWSIE